MAHKLECHGFYAWQGNWPRLFGAPFPNTKPESGVAPLLTRVPAVWFSFDDDGSLTVQNPYANRPHGWEKVIGECRRRGIAVDMTVAYLDGPKLETILACEKVVDRIVQGIARAVVPYDGVNIDLEGLGSKSRHGKESRIRVRQHFNRFLHKLSTVLALKDKEMYVCLHPLNSWFTGYDYREIGRLSDGLIIMAYHYGPTPEPVPLVEESVTMALGAGVPGNKLILGILALKPYETPKSFGEIISIAKRHDIRGIALWKISFLNEEYLAVLHKQLRPV